MLPEASQRAGRKDWRPKAFAGVAVLLCAASFAFPLRGGVAAVQQAVGVFGPWGALAFVALYVAWTMTTLPAIPLAVLAGLLFGPLAGAGYALLGGTLGTSLTFVVGRNWGRGYFRRLAERHPRLARLDAMIERNAVLVVAFLRLAPVFPVNLLNYGLGATRMRFRQYFLVSLVMTIPGALLYAGVGDILKATLAGAPVSHALIAVLGTLAILSVGTGLHVKRRFALAHARVE
ncbi:TVP38/TMEM64 family protein [Candidatus Poribacteria bacterium]|nr:TVP38/TMEM64 family protein [Candidatus Poribacteria bacterium]